VLIAQVFLLKISIQNVRLVDKTELRKNSDDKYELALFFPVLVE
jgi:hypothetical protein